MFFNSQGKAENTYDAIVVGTGISGGWAAKELCEKGLKTLVLERGRDVKHPNYPTASMDPWDFENGLRGRTPREEIEKHYFKQARTGYTIREASKHWFVKDDEHPYSEVQRFDWVRGYHVGGRSIMWGRQSYRFSDLDFAANAKDGIAVDWPIRYQDIAPWYDYVETFAGISGQNEGLAQLPDGQFLKPMEMTCVEEKLRESTAKNFGGRVVTIGRAAHLTEYNPAVHKGTRGACQFRNRCIRGCPYGAYFSSNAATLPVAEATGNMTLRPNSVVHQVIYDKDTKRAKGVVVRDAETGEDIEFYTTGVVFLCASTLGSTFILMNTRGDGYETGLGNASGQLGKNVMDHHFRTGARGESDEFAEQYVKGRRPNGFYIPRFQNLGDSASKRDYLRGWGYQGRGNRTDWTSGVREMTVGPQLKEALVAPGPWQIGMTAFAETLPDERNQVMLNEEVRDKHDLPTLTMDAAFRENELAMRADMANEAAEMLEAAGFKNVQTYDGGSWPGLGIHEMGTARMGRDPKTSVLNGNNQLWDCPNLYVTDGACMTSAACVNPSLTYMALTARAVDHAVSELNKTNM